MNPMNTDHDVYPVYGSREVRDEDATEAGATRQYVARCYGCGEMIEGDVNDTFAAWTHVSKEGTR